MRDDILLTCGYDNRVEYLTTNAKGACCTMGQKLHEDSDAQHAHTPRELAHQHFTAEGRELAHQMRVSLGIRRNQQMLVNIRALIELLLPAARFKHTGHFGQEIVLLTYK